MSDNNLGPGFIAWPVFTFPKNKKGVKSSLCCNTMPLSSRTPIRSNTGCTISFRDGSPTINRLPPLSIYFLTPPVQLLYMVCADLHHHFCIRPKCYFLKFGFSVIILTTTFIYYNSFLIALATFCAPFPLLFQNSASPSGQIVLRHHHIYNTAPGYI